MQSCLDRKHTNNTAPDPMNLLEGVRFENFEAKNVEDANHTILLGFVSGADGNIDLPHEPIKEFFVHKLRERVAGCIGLCVCIQLWPSALQHQNLCRRESNHNIRVAAHPHHTCSYPRNKISIRKLQQCRGRLQWHAVLNFTFAISG